MNNWLTYLFEVSICHALLYLLYYGLFKNLSFFQINRIYLLIAAISGFVIPVIQIPFWENHVTEIISLAISEAPVQLNTNSNTDASQLELTWLISLVFIAYLVGVILYFSKLLGTLFKISLLVKKHGFDECNEIKTVHLTSGPPIFVFLNFVFINMHKMNIHSNELKQVIEHEKNHILQKHTLDNIMMELIITVCWFNPILRLMKRELNNIHEFYADQKVTQNIQDLDSYSRLILRLSSSKDEHIPLTHQFSMYNIKQRIIMLNQKKNKNSQLIRYFMIVPCISILLLAFSCEEKSLEETNNISTIETSKVVGKISWRGNTIYTSKFLSDHLGISEGDQFNDALINNKLNYQPDGGDIASLFMDKGYLFFAVDVKKEEHSGRVDLFFDIIEGDIITINEIFVTGNKEVDSEKIRSLISLKPGEVFNRSKLINSQKNIAESGLVDPENVGINPFPNIDNRTVDIEFKVREL